MTQSGPAGPDDLPADGASPADIAPATTPPADHPAAEQPPQPPPAPSDPAQPVPAPSDPAQPVGAPWSVPAAVSAPPPPPQPALVPAGLAARPAPGAQRAVAGALLALIGVAAGVIITLLVVKGGSGGEDSTAAPGPSASPAASAAASPAASPAESAGTGQLVEPRNTTQGAIVVGNPQAQVQLRVYEDYLCPYCAQFEQENGAQLQQWLAAGDISVDFRMLAILDRATTTAYSSRAAMASAAVRDLAPDKWLAFHSGLFASQPAEGGAGLTDQTLADLAGQVGAPEAEVLSALTSRRFAGWVGAVSQVASQGEDKVQGTPTVIVVDTKANKRYLIQDWSATSLKKAVEQALGKTSS